MTDTGLENQPGTSAMGARGASTGILAGTDRDPMSDRRSGAPKSAPHLDVSSSEGESPRCRVRVVFDRVP